MTKAREIIMAAMGMLPIAANASSPAPVADGNETQRRPNIIFIMCDDMGYGDLGCYGQQRIETPNLDRMASQGMRFTQAYAGSPVSAPSRASFMTGQHTGHTHVRGNREYWRSSSRANMYGNNADYSLIGQEPYLMNHKIIPEVMKEAGYNTGMFGKWAGGYYNTDYPNTYLLDANGNSDTSKSGRSSSASLPNKRGIDCYYGYICQFQAHTYYPNFLNRYDPEKYGDQHVVVDVLEENIKHKAVSTGDRDFENRSQYTSDLIHQYALEWIDRQAEKDAPFLGIFTYTLPHAELWQPQDSLVAKYKEKFKGQDGGDWGGEFGSWYYRAPSRHAQFAAMISRLDAQVGEIFQKLEEKGIADNTLVIFTSDNGPHTEGGADPTWFNSNGGLQGTKRQTHEGGVRVPFIAKGPGVPAGVVNDHQLAFYDVMPTLLDYAGADGSAYSLEASTDERRYDGISFYNTLTGNDAEQEKHEFLYWEFHETNQVALRMGDWKLVAKSGVPALYDLSKDPHEDNNVAAQNPKVLRQMLEIIHQQHTASSLFNVTMPEIPEDDGSNIARLTFTRTGTDASSVTVSVVDESGKAIEGASATLVSTSHNFKGTAGNVTENILCPNVNATDGPTIKLEFTVTGLNEFYTFNELGLHIHALNGSNGYQDPNDNVIRKWNVDVDTQDSDFGTLSDVDIAAGITGANKMWDVSSASNINTGKELTITLTITRGTENKGCFFGLSEIKLTFNEDKLAFGEIPSGFYRFKNISTNKYLVAPEVLPAKADNYDSFTVTLSSEQDDADTHRDVWYVQNLGTNSSNAGHANEVIYRIWCFQGGYGLGTDRQPRVVGSYDNAKKCPRLYSIQKTTDYKYVIAGHFYDNVEAVAANIFGLNHGTGAITNKNFLNPYNDNTTVSREVTDKKDESAQWEISIVSPDELSKSVSIGSIGVGTFAFNSDVQIPEGVKAYVATERGEKIGLTKLEGTIPARMGVVLRKTDKSKTDFTFEAVHGLGIGMKAVGTGASLTPVEDHDNLLVGTLAETQLAVGDYILTKKKVDGVATDEVVFGKISKASNIAANKAYLPKEAVSQTRGFYTLMWDDVETGIEEIQGAVQKDGIFVEGQQIVIVRNGLKYNAKGQRVK